MNESNATEHKSHRTVFIAVFLMLCALTAMSFWISRSHLMDDRVVGWSCMMAVSVAKALLVILVFMHLWWERSWKYILTVPAMIMGTLLVMLLVPDIGFRYSTYPDDRRAVAAEEQQFIPEHSNSDIDSESNEHE